MSDFFPRLLPVVCRRLGVPVALSMVYSAGQHNSTNLLMPKPDLFRANGDQNQDPHKKTSFKFSKKFVKLCCPALYQTKHPPDL